VAADRGAFAGTGPTAAMDVYGLIGNPVGHSLSPPMHEAAYAELGLDARYVALEPAPGDGEAAIEGAAALGLAGLNVTIPFKRDVLPAVEPTELARRIGAINTVDFATDPPTGHNTDAAGVRRAFDHHGVALDGREAVVVGAGGAGRAVAFALADAGARVSIANRTVERATDLAGEVGDAASAHGLDELGTLLGDADVLVNATSVGMEEDRSPVDGDDLHADLAVLDAVYTPLETRLLREASAAGATTIDGAWMLLFQGVEALELWTGREAPVTEMDRALRAEL
jgi:shikimate dehydrogenase